MSDDDRRASAAQGAPDMAAPDPLDELPDQPPAVSPSFGLVGLAPALTLAVGMHSIPLALVVAVWTYSLDLRRRQWQALSEHIYMLQKRSVERYYTLHDRYAALCLVMELQAQEMREHEH